MSKKTREVAWQALAFKLAGTCLQISGRHLPSKWQALAFKVAGTCLQISGRHLPSNWQLNPYHHGVEINPILDSKGQNGLKSLE